MECWVPLFNTLLNSPSPETQASLWLQQSFTTTTTTTPTSFLSLLTKPTNTIIISPSPHTKRVMWVQTLPNAVQARILSFLAFDHQRFCSRELYKLAKNILSDDYEVDFWVKKTARQLLDKLPGSDYEWVSCLNLDSEGERVDEDFGSLPDWLKDAAASSNELVLPWLPISVDELDVKMRFGTCEDSEDLMVVDDVEKGGEDLNKCETEVNIVCSKNYSIEPEIEKKAICLKSQILNFESTSKTLGLAEEIRQLCIGRGGNSSLILGLIEPWKVDDETASLLISHFSNGDEDELGWSGHLFCSIVLPKLLVLKEPASRVLVAATIEYCKAHPRAAVYALLLPLILVKDGINNPISDVMIKIMRECLHPAHVSAFCQNLLCGELDERKFICLSCHKSLISNNLVWTEPLFNLFQNILNHKVHFTQDSVDQLVYRVLESADRFSKSLKFGNFLLCLVNKCAPLLKPHKLSLIEAVEHTNTLVTKSILSKLASL